MSASHSFSLFSRFSTFFPTQEDLLNFFYSPQVFCLSLPSARRHSLLKNCLKNLKFQITFASLPIQPTVFFTCRVAIFKNSSDQKLPRGQKKWQYFKLFPDSAHPDRDTGEWHIDGGALFIYSEVLGCTKTVLGSDLFKYLVLRIIRRGAAALLYFCLLYTSPSPRD